jgi:two-component system, NarL family, sensor kinase
MAARLLSYILASWMTLICVHSRAQTPLIDSLKTEITKPTHDTIKVFVYLRLAGLQISYDTALAYDHLQLAFVLAQKLNWNYAWANYYQNKADIVATSMMDKAAVYFDSALFFYNKSLEEKRHPGEVVACKLSIATTNGQKADLVLKQGKSQEAIATYITALEAWKASDDHQKNEAIGTYYSKIATVYYDLYDFNKALEYDKLSLSYRQAGSTEEAMAWALVYVCDDFYALKLPDSALLYLNIARPIVEKIKNHRLNIQFYSKLGQGKRMINDFRGAIVDYQRTVAEAKLVNNKFQIFATLKLIGFCYEKLEEYSQARHYFVLALGPATEHNYVKEKIEILQHLVVVEEKMHNNSGAFSYLKQLTLIKDSVNSDASRKAIAEIENKYQAAEKEKSIIRLEKEKEVQVLSLNQKTESIKQKTTLNYLLASFLILFLLLAFVGIRNLRHRQKLAKQQDLLQEQKIRELEKDKQLVAVDSMLKGQEEERTRLAKDLHDGLGGMLSGVKFSLMNMKSNLIINHENVIMFERSLDMLDTSIMELRRVAHNMMPEALVKFGLDEALKDYCDNINNAGIVQVKYQSFGMEKRLDTNTEIIVYRIVQELFANIFKHATAQEVLVQLLREDDRLSITVEDNGKGFDIEELKNSKGSGWANIRSRVDYLKGKLDLNSEPGKGTSVNIELHV